MTFISCTIYGNSAGAGGAGGQGGSGALSNFSGGRGGDGGTGGNGGLYCTGSVQIVACTFTANVAGRGGNGASGGAGANNPGGFGGVGGNGGNGGAGGGGGGVYGPAASSNLFTLQNVLIAQNLAGRAGSAGSGGAGGSGLHAGANGAGGTSGAAGFGPDLAGAFQSLGHNLVGVNAGNTGFTNNLLGDLVGTNVTINARIGTLVNNGGATLTAALLAGSPALDAGDDTVPNLPLSLATDERGYPRLSGTHVDIGAYELQRAATPLVFDTSAADGVLRLMLTNTPGTSLTVLAASYASTPSAGWSVVGRMSEIQPGQFLWVDTILPTRPQRFYQVRCP